jgi:hypothetical protein
MNQRVVPLAGFHDDIATPTAITAGWAATRHKLLPPKSQAAVAAVAGLYANCGFINEHENSRWSSVVGQTQRQKTFGTAALGYSRVYRGGLD